MVFGEKIDEVEMSGEAREKDLPAPLVTTPGSESMHSTARKIDPMLQ
jgi:hypothetical protein